MGRKRVQLTRKAHLVRRGTIRPSTRTRERRRAYKELDDLCRRIVFARDGNKCLRCGKQTRLQWAHIEPRGYLSIRWQPDNCMTLCAGCHRWWHDNPVAAGAWYVLKFGTKPKWWGTGKVDVKLTKLWLEQWLRSATAPSLSPGPRVARED